MPAEESAAEPAASPAAQRGVHFEQLTTETEPAVVRMVARTSEREDDFAALQPAALSGKGMKKSKSLMTLVEEGGNVQVLDAKKLGRETQSKIMDRLLKEGTSDNFEMLSKIRKRLHNVGLDNPTITVRYRNLSVLAHLQVGHRTVPTLTSVVTSRLQPMVDSLHKNHKMHATDFSIIDKVSGVIKPGCYTLLLGPPGSGKTTFLRALAGYHPRGQHLKVVADELTYNGQNFHQFEVQRSAAYISQVDHHYGELTVRETFEFSARCQSSGFKRDLVEELLSREAAQGIKPDPDTDAYLRATIFGSKKNNLVVEMVIRLLGLHTCADTVVGNQMLRGVSGGQKKRVSTGEMVVGPSKALFADEISTGLDSNTTYQICKAIGNLSRVMNGTVVVGLLQPQPETFDLFDDVILLSSGKKYWSLDSGKPHKYISSATIERRFKETSAWKAVEAELDAPFEKLPEHRGALAHRKFGNSYDHLVRANLRRFWLLAQRNKIFTIIRTLQIGLMSFMMGNAFWRISKDTVADGNLFMGTFFYSQLYMMIGGLAEMHVLVERLHNMYKQRDMQFYPGWSFALPAFLIRLPFCFLEATLWTFICYFIIGYDASSARIIMFWAIMFLQNVWSISFMQLVASVCRNDTIATNIAAAFLLVFWNTGGFVLNKVDIPPWWVGAYWASPFAYNARALAINEFTSGNWMVPNPYNPSSILGYDILHNWGLQTDYWWCWVAVGYNIGSIILNVCCFMCTTTYLGALHPPATITPEALQDLKESRGSISHRPSLDLESAGNTVTTLPKAAAATNVAVASPLPGTTDAGMQVVPAGVPVEMGHVAPVLPRGPEQLTYGADDEWVHRGSFVMRASLREGFTEQTAETYRKTSAIPYEPLSMTFRDVTYSVPVPQDADRSKADIPADGIHAGQLRLLKDVNGVFRPGVLTALMGASGAGKTTLMDVLAGRKTGGIITGDVRVNGYPKEEKTFARVMGYVEQTDIHLPRTTVEEACHFSAHLRLPTTVDAKTRAAFVEEVLAVVELSRLRTAYVGVPGVSGLSVEQRKRLTMAVELVANPSIVFMDEPTSGLDARAAGIVMAAVRNTVDTGRTVVCTIHQPSIDIFEAFDELLLLKPGGRTIFAGPMGDNSQLLINYFSSIPGVDSIKPRYNPANWMLEQTNPGREAALGVDFSEIYATSERAQAQAELIAKHSEPPEGAKPLSYSDQHVPNDIVQFLVNFKRFSKMQWRSPDYNVSRLGITLLVGFVFGSMFWRKGDNRTSVGGVLNIMGVLYASTLFLGIINCMSVQHLIAVQRAVMYRERAAGVYNVLPFSLAQHAVELPYLLFQSVVYAAIVYWMVWFDRDAGKFFYFLFLFFLTMCYMTFFGISTTCLTPAVAFANVVASFFFAFWNLFCGFLIPSQQLRGWVIWLYWSNPVSWSLYGLVTTQLGDFDDEYITTLTGESMTIQQFLESEFFLKNSMKGVTIPILFGFIFGFAFTSFAALKWLNFLKR